MSKLFAAGRIPAHSSVRAMDMGYQRSYVVLYRREDIMAPADPPFAFKCMAEDTEHAEEQCLNAEPDADIVWVVDTDDVQAAYADYWNTPAGFIDDIDDPAGSSDTTEP